MLAKLLHCQNHNHACYLVREDCKAHIVLQVLKGKTVDTNTPWLAKLLYSRGVDLVRVEVVRDNKVEIGESLQRLKGMVGPDGFIFTSGGIGPTHDDMVSVLTAMFLPNARSTS